MNIYSYWYFWINILFNKLIRWTQIKDKITTTPLNITCKTNISNRQPCIRTKHLNPSSISSNNKRKRCLVNLKSCLEDKCRLEFNKLISKLTRMCKWKLTYCSTTKNSNLNSRRSVSKLTRLQMRLTRSNNSNCLWLVSRRSWSQMKMWGWFLAKLRFCLRLLAKCLSRKSLTKLLSTQRSKTVKLFKETTSQEWLQRTKPLISCLT